MKPRSSREARLLARLPRPTVRGAGFLVVGSALVLTGLLLDRGELFFVGAVLLAAPIVAAAGLALVRPRLDVQRRVAPGGLAESEKARVTLTVTVRGSFALVAAHWRDAHPPHADAVGWQSLPALRPGSLAAPTDADRATLAYDLTVHRRGVHRLGPLVVRRSDPLGLLTQESRHGPLTRLVVVPTVVPLGLPTAHGEASEGDVPRALPRAGDADDLLAREYRSGDSLRRVDWRATARRGELMVRQEGESADPAVTVVLDTAVTAARPSSVFEHAIRLTASVAALFLRSGQGVELVLTAVEPGHGRGIAQHPRGGSGALLEFLAGVQPARSTPSPRPLAVAAPEAPVFAILPGGDDEHAGRLLHGLHRQARGAVAVVYPSTPPPLVDRLQAEGWTILPTSADEDLAALWQRILHAQAGSHAAA